MLALRCGTAHPAALAELRRHGDVSVATLDPAADRSTVDGVLSEVDGRRLVVLGDLAGLSKIVLRLLRRDLLPDTPVAAIVDSPQWTKMAGLPRDPVAAARVAATGTPAPRGLIRDDQGGIVLAQARLVPESGRHFQARAYVEDDLLIDAPVRWLEVTPTAGALTAAANRRRRLSGRAIALSCQPPAVVTVDGVALRNARRRATFWYEPDRWQLVR